jgi:DNA-binding transcriptional LysR family regulator
MKIINFTTLRIVIGIAETGSLSAASRQHHLTLAAVSKRLRELEALLQVTLFIRVPKGMVLTDAGRMLVVHARQMLYEMDRMNANLSGFRSGEAGAVRVGGNTSAITQFLPEELCKFSLLHPGIRLDLAEFTSDQIVSRLADGRLDVGLFSANAVHKGLEVRPFMDNRLCVVVRADSKLARRKSVAFSSVLDHSLVALESDSTLMHLLQSKANDRHLRVSVQVRSFDVVCRFVQAGVGIGVLPVGSARLYAPSMKLAIVELSDPWSEYKLLLGTRSLDTLNAPSRLLFNALSASASERTALLSPQGGGRRVRAQA